MAISAATAIAGANAAGGLLGALGGGGDVKSAPTSGYQTYPQWLKDIYEETASPAILEEFARPYEVLPMGRYDADPNDPFTSQALAEYQAYSDATGGFFNPYGSGQNALDWQGQKDDAARKAAEAEAIDNLRNEMLGREYLQSISGLKGYGNARPQNYTPEQLATIGGFTGGALSGPMSRINDPRKEGYEDYMAALTAGRLK